LSIQRQTYFLVSSEGVPIRNIADYSPFGVQLDGRTIQGDFYRYGFQNQEKDDDIKGAGNSVNYRYRMHDPRVGRFFAVDPLENEYPYNSSYAFSENRVLDGNELEGLEFLKSSEALIYMQKGELFLKLENCSSMASNGKNKLKYFTKYPSQSYIGANPAGGRVLVFDYKYRDSGPDGTKNERTTEQNLNNNRPKTLSSGGTSFDKRYKVYNHGGAVRGLGVGSLVLNAIHLGHQAYTGYSFMFESIELSRQKNEVYDKVMEVINYGLQNDLIPKDHQNEESMDHIFNTVLFGGSKNTPKEIKKLGLDLFESFKNSKVENINSVGKKTHEFEMNDPKIPKADNTRVAPKSIRGL